MDEREREREALAGRGVFLPPSRMPGAKADGDGGSRVSGTGAGAGTRRERETAVDVRGYGGRRLGLEIDSDEQARREAMDRHLLELARRAIEKHRPGPNGASPTTRAFPEQ